MPQSWNRHPAYPLIVTQLLYRFQRFSKSVMLAALLREIFAPQLKKPDHSSVRVFV